MLVPDSIATDDVLFAAMARGDVCAFNAFYERHAARAYSLAARILGDDQLAEEATQDAFHSLWRGRISYDNTRASPTAWLLSIVRHRATDCWRSESRRPAQADDSEARLSMLVASDDVEAFVIAREQRREVVAQVSGLPATQREAVALSYYGGLTHSEIALELELPSGTAKSRLRLGVNRLRAAMCEDGLGEPRGSVR